MSGDDRTIDKPTDIWARWLLHDRFGGDETALVQTIKTLEPIRDRVLRSARIRRGDVVLDVGCGDGLLGFGALGLVGPEGGAVFADISEDLLGRCQSIAENSGVADRCRFIVTTAETLEGIEEDSVDVVMTRSVLIYVDDKKAAFRSFHRVLKPGGRLSLFEPINRRIADLNRDLLFGYDTAPCAELADKVRAAFAKSAPDDGPMMGFDETDLLLLAEDAGFDDIEVSLELSSTTEVPFSGVGWQELMQIRPNPRAPTYGEAVESALNIEERNRMEAHLRPLVESASEGRSRMAVAYLQAVASLP